MKFKWGTNWARWVIAAAVLTISIGCRPTDNSSAKSATAPATNPSNLQQAGAFTQTIPGTSLSLEMVPIPAGRFRMGSPDSELGRKSNEGPQFDVDVEPFYMSKYEITWDLYNEFSGQYSRVVVQNHPSRDREPGVDAVTYPTPIYSPATDPMLDRMGGHTGKFPAVSMSRFAARQFTKWLSKKTGRFYRLPSETEWEYACRAGSTTAYSFGDDTKELTKYGWFVDNSEEKDGDPGYHRVGMKLPNAWGLYDMHGNVAEWVIDQYAAGDYARFGADHVISSARTIRWPSARYPAVIRGGGYENEAGDCRAAARRIGTRALNLNDSDDPKSPHWDASAFDVGFRIVSPLREPPEAEKLRWWNADDPVTIETLKRDREVYELITPAKKSPAP